ncbi:hypothetical protein BJX62DRAFT_241094 [Aspergillus germanicus]
MPEKNGSACFCSSRTGSRMQPDNIANDEAAIRRPDSNSVRTGPWNRMRCAGEPLDGSRALFSATTTKPPLALPVPAGWRAGRISFSTIEHLLPDMDIPVNGMDEFRLIISWEALTEARAQDHARRLFLNSEAAVDEYMALPAFGPNTLPTTQCRHSYTATS